MRKWGPDHDGIPTILARDVGAIPREYQPTNGYDIILRGAPPNLPDPR